MFRAIVLSAITALLVGCSDKGKPTKTDQEQYYLEDLHDSEISQFDVCLPTGESTGPDSLVSDPIPDNRFNARVRMSKEFDARWNEKHNHLIGMALDKWESVILQRPTNNTPLSGQPLGAELSFAEFNIPDEEYFGEYELEILLTYKRSGPFAGSTSMAAPDIGNGFYLPFSYFVVNEQFFSSIEDETMNENLIYLVLLHEFGHALGFSGMSREITEYNEEIGGRFGRTCGWTGPNSLLGWNRMIGADPLLSSVPLEIDCGHWDYDDSNWRKIHDIMFASMGNATANISPVTVGYFDDLGFAVDYSNADEVLAEHWGVRRSGKASTLPFEFKCDINWEEYGIDLGIPNGPYD